MSVVYPLANQMRILAVVSGEFGRRFARNVREHGPASWQVAEWTAPARFPIVVEEPLDFIPAGLPAADLILAAGEHPGIAELLPEVAKMTGARAMIAPIDRVEWLPKGLMNQLAGWMKEIGVACVFPKPFCSLTEKSYSLRGLRVEYDSPIISEFARHFGRPRVKVTLGRESKAVARVQVERDATCGCMRHVADQIVGVKAEDAEYEAGMLHHHYPCLASMGVDPDYDDTLLHVSGNIFRDAFSSEVKPYVVTHYFRPEGFIENKGNTPNDRKEEAATGA